jgi:hypothetical protein
MKVVTSPPRAPKEIKMYYVDLQTWHVRPINGSRYNFLGWMKLGLPIQSCEWDHDLIQEKYARHYITITSHTVLLLLSFTLESEKKMKYCHVTCLHELSTYFKFPCTIGFIGYKCSVINLNLCCVFQPLTWIYFTYMIADPTLLLLL